MKRSKKNSIESIKNNMKNNIKNNIESGYPIKYAIMKIEGEIDCNSYSGVEYGVIANIVSKCYVISEKIEYDKNGNYNWKYEVVFPYQRESRYNGGFERIEPKYNYDSECINSTIIYELYDNLEEALEASKDENNKVLEKTIGGLPFSDDIKKRIEEEKEKHDIIINTYRKLENLIETGTPNMVVKEETEPEINEVTEDVPVNLDDDKMCELVDNLSLEKLELLKQFIIEKTCDDSLYDEDLEEEYDDETQKLRSKRRLTLRQYFNPEREF